MPSTFAERIRGNDFQGLHFAVRSQVVDGFRAVYKGHPSLIERVDEFRSLNGLGIQPSARRSPPSQTDSVRRFLTLGQLVALRLTQRRSAM